MGYMFFGASAFNSNLARWNVACVTTMDSMFSGPSPGASAFKSDLSGWNVASVSDMRRMFGDLPAFNSDLSGWNVASVRDMSQMFTSAYAFSGDIGKLNVARSTEMVLMIYRVPAFASDVSGWNTARVRGLHGMFEGASAFNSDISRWNTALVVDMEDMLHAAQDFDRNILGWNVLSVTALSGAPPPCVTPLVHPNLRCLSPSRRCRAGCVRLVAAQPAAATAESLRRSCPQSAADRIVVHIAGTFGEPVGLSGCNKLAIYYAWGATLQQAYPAFKDYSCSYCGRITSSSITPVMPPQEWCHALT